MRDLTREELEELAALAFMLGRVVRRECKAGRCGGPIAGYASFGAGHAAGDLVALFGADDTEATPSWVIAATARTMAKTRGETMVREHAAEVN